MIRASIAKELQYAAASVSLFGRARCIIFSGVQLARGKLFSKGSAEGLAEALKLASDALTVTSLLLHCGLFSLKKGATFAWASTTTWFASALARLAVSRSKGDRIESGLHLLFGLSETFLQRHLWLAGLAGCSAGLFSITRSFDSS